MANPNETVNISLTQVGGSSADLIGAAIIITDDDSGDTLFTATWTGSMITTEIPMGMYYTVSVEAIVGYLDCPDKSYLAGYQTERNISFQYKATGAFIEATDGTLYESSSWTSSGKTANAIVLLTNTCQVRMALTEALLPINDDPADPLYLYLDAKTEAAAKVDYNGEENTNKIINFNTTYGTNTTSYAAPYCKNFTFTYPSNQHGCIPALGQLQEIYQNKTQIEDCLSVCGGTSFGNAQFSSTYYGPYREGVYCTWILSWNNGAVACGSIAIARFVRPVSAYEL